MRPPPQREYSAFILTQSWAAPIVRRMPCATHSTPTPAADPLHLDRASASVTVLTLDELAHGLPLLQPPVAYRLSLDSGVGYKNIRRAFEQPMAVRLQTWHKLLHSLRIRMVAAATPEDLIWSGAATRLIDFGSRAGATAAAADASNLRGCRLALGWSRAELARRAGVGLDAIVSLERGQGLAGTLVRVSAALGLRLLLALPPGHATLEDLWAERAGGCLDEPAQFPKSGARYRPLPAPANRRAANPAAAPDAPPRGA